MGILDDIYAAICRFENNPLPKAVILPDASAVEQLHRAFPRGELTGMKALISDKVPPGTAWIISDPPKRDPAPWKPMFLPNVHSIVKIVDCP